VRETGEELGTLKVKAATRDLEARKVLAIAVHPLRNRCESALQSKRKSEEDSLCVSACFARHLQRSVFNLLRSASNLKGLNLIFGGLNLTFGCQKPISRNAERDFHRRGAKPPDIMFRASRSWVRVLHSLRFRAEAEAIAERISSGCKTAVSDWNSRDLRDSFLLMLFLFATFLLIKIQEKSQS
jgi:hypothetical protein